MDSASFWRWQVLDSVIQRVASSGLSAGKFVNGFGSVRNFPAMHTVMYEEIACCVFGQDNDPGDTCGAQAGDGCDIRVYAS